MPSAHPFRPGGLDVRRPRLSRQGIPIVVAANVRFRGAGVRHDVENGSAQRRHCRGGVYYARRLSKFNQKRYPAV
jgi:hypothetical protein